MAPNFSWSGMVLMLLLIEVGSLIVVRLSLEFEMFSVSVRELCIYVLT